LIPLAEIWGLRGYSSVFATTKLLQYDPAGEVAGGYLTWDKVYFYDPITYFKTNFLALATNLASDQYVFHPYNGYDSSQTGPANPMAVFPASEWLTTVIGGGFGQAWPYRSGCTLYRKDASGGGDAAYNYRAVSGDFDMATRADSVQATANHEAGLMIRESLSTNAPFIFLSVSPDQQVHVSYRSVTGGSITVGPAGAVPADDRPVWIKLERRAGVFKASYSYGAEPSYSTLLETTISTNANLLCGLAAASTATATWGAASFSDVAVSELAAERPVLLGLNQTGSTSFSILFAGTVGSQYILQETTSLTNSWTDVGAAVTCVPGTNSLLRSSSAPAKFWRVRQFP
jgi:regulation of enolase protein 1 (concanavalin A-like superfamily)